MDKETYNQIWEDIDRIQDAKPASIYNILERLVDTTIPNLLKEIIRFQELERAVYQLMFVPLDEEKTKILQNEVYEIFRNQIEWNGDDDGEDSELERGLRQSGDADSDTDDSSGEGSRSEDSSDWTGRNSPYDDEEEE